MAAEKEKDRLMELKLKKSKLEYFDASKYVKFVPPFIEKDVDKYFLLFEKVAKDLNWPLDKYTILLQSALKGKASETTLLCLQSRRLIISLLRKASLRLTNLFLRLTGKNSGITRRKMLKHM